MIYLRQPETGRFCFISQPVESLLGYSRTAWLSHPDLWRDSIHPDDRTAVLTTFGEGLASHRSFSLDYRLVTADGGVRWIRDAAVWIATTDEAPAIWQGTWTDVTAQRQTETELRRSNERFAALFGTDAVGIAISSVATGRILDINERAETILRLGREELVGRGWLELGFWEGQEAERRALIDRVMAGAPVRMEPLRLRHPSGDVLDLALSVEQIELGGEPCLVSLFDDVSERHRVEIEARRLAAIVDASGDAIIRHDLDGVIQTWNVGAERLYGYTAAEAIGGPIELLAPPELAAEVSELRSRILDGEPLVRVETRRLTKDRRPIDVSLTISPIRDRSESMVAAAVIARDVTDLKLADRELRQRADLLDHAYDAIFVWTWDGPITFWNDGARRLYGFTRDEAVGHVSHGLLQTVHPGGTTTFLAELERTAFWEGELLQTRQDGESIVVESRHVVVEQDGQLLVLEANRDVTARKRAEDEAQRLNAELERRVAQRTAQLEAVNKELEAFTYSASHDLRAPLRGIDGFSQALLEDYGDRLDEDARHYVDRIRRATDRMGRLIDDLLSLSRITRAEVSKDQINISALARQVCDELAAAEPTRLVEVVVEPGLTAAADQRLLRIALTNLLGNAWKFTSKRSNARIEFAADRAGTEPVFLVRDNGAGFDMRHADRLFGAFQRLHHARDYPGSGIGLAIVERIVHRHGGRVWVEAEVDRGATFFFTLGSPESDDESEGIDGQ